MSQGQPQSEDAEHRDVGEESAENDEALSKQSLFEVLSARRRRQALRRLFERDGAASLRELSEELAAAENDVSPAEVTYKQRTRVYTALRQNHLPKLDDEGIVEFDVRSGDTTLRPAADDLRPYLYEDRDSEDRRSRTDLLGAAFALGTAAGLGVGVWRTVNATALVAAASLFVLVGAVLLARAR